MSEPPLRIRIVAEGISDFHVLKAAIRHVLGDGHDISMRYPEFSVGFGHLGQHGTGWKGVLGKLSQMRDQYARTWAAFWQNIDVLIIHLDGEVAWEKDLDPAWKDVNAVMVCCPPCNDAPEALETIARSRMGPGGADQRIVLAIPMMETECWLLPLFRKKVTVDECAPKPSKHFMGGRPKLVEQSGKKTGSRYREIQDEIKQRWDEALVVSRARFFQYALGTAVSTRSGTP